MRAAGLCACTGSAGQCVAEIRLMGELPDQDPTLNKVTPSRAGTQLPLCRLCSGSQPAFSDAASEHSRGSKL